MSQKHVERNKRDVSDVDVHWCAPVISLLQEENIFQTHDNIELIFGFMGMPSHVSEDIQNQTNKLEGENKKNKFAINLLYKKTCLSMYVIRYLDHAGYKKAF